ncbi:hypothetical protein ABZT06_32525 [Streptomyces sp. NPDC005483]|uniref:hypothetical protein n=1 Tax=Streptomyces sp. NPDC005483 TaxID=3154882 RepID=UPI0033AF180A
MVVPVPSAPLDDEAVTVFLGPFDPFDLNLEEFPEGPPRGLDIAHGVELDSTLTQDLQVSWRHSSLRVVNDDEFNFGLLGTTSSLRRRKRFVFYLDEFTRLADEASIVDHRTILLIRQVELAIHPDALPAG